MLWDGKTMQRVTRWVCEEINGENLEGKDVHHLCENKRCVHPEHLVGVTRREHVVELTPSSIMYKNAHKSRCHKGHPLVASNVYLNSRGWRQCRICRADGQRRYKAKRRLAT